MSMIQFIKRDGERVLWRLGNYLYQIENRSTGEKKDLIDFSYEEAIDRFYIGTKMIGFSTMTSKKISFDANMKFD